MWDPQLFLALLAVVQVAHAQVEVEGAFYDRGLQKASISTKWTHTISPVNGNTVLQLDEIAKTTASLPQRIGYGVDLVLDIAKDGKWTTDVDSRVWRMTIHSKGAAFLSVIFSDFYLPPGGELYVIGAEVSENYILELCSPRSF